MHGGFPQVGDREHDVVGVMSLSTEQIFNHIRADTGRQYMYVLSSCCTPSAA